MIIKRMTSLRNIIGDKIDTRETEITLTDDELREAAQEFNKICKRDDIRTVLRDMGIENMTDDDIDYMADQLIERMEYDESWYWSKVEETVNNYLGM